MAINFGAYGSGASTPTAAEQYAQEAAMLPDLGAEFEKGQDRVQEQQDAERQMKYDELQHAQNTLDYNKDLDEFNQQLADRQDLDNQLLEIEQANADVESGVCAKAAVITGEESDACPTVDLDPNWRSWSDSKKKQFIRSLNVAETLKQNGVQLANDLTNPTYLADQGIDPNDPSNQEVISVFNNIQTARKSNKRTIVGDDGKEVDVYDFIVKVPDGKGGTKEVTIPNGDFETYANRLRQSPSITNIDGMINFSSLRGASGNELVNENSLDKKKADFIALFGGDKPQLSLQSFQGRFKDPTPDTPWTTEDAWTVYSATKIAELKESNNYGVPSSYQTTRNNLQTSRNQLEKSKLDLEAARNPKKAEIKLTGGERLKIAHDNESKRKINSFLKTIPKEGEKKPKFPYGDLSTLRFLKTTAGTIKDVTVDDNGNYTIDFGDDESEPMTPQEFHNALKNLLEVPEDAPSGEIDLSDVDFSNPG